MDFLIRRAVIGDVPALQAYAASLSEETKLRFAPHDFSSATLEALILDPSLSTMLVAVEPSSSTIAAYFIARLQMFDYDRDRWNRYGVSLNNHDFALLAPSVADNFQSLGLGTRMLLAMKNELKVMGRRHLILWGGVQATNQKALTFYEKNGFRYAGKFEYEGMNIDMICSF